MLKIAIIEDEPKMAEALTKCIKVVSLDCNIVAYADSIETGLKLFSTYKIDCAFMDVELKDGLSFEILKQLPKIDFHIIFVTAYSHFAVTAFNYSALDYIVKPADVSAISRALERVKAKQQQSHSNHNIEVLLENLNTGKQNQKIILQTAESTYFVKLNDIVRCESDNNYCNFILTNGEKIMVSKSLKDYENILPKEVFFRTHQSHLININYIHRIKKRTFKVILNNGEITPLAVRRKDELLDLMKKNG